MSCDPRSTPRSGKFSRIKNIRTSAGKSARGEAAAATPAVKDDEFSQFMVTCDGSPTVRHLERQQQTAAFRDDCDEKVRRHRYGQMVVRMVEQASQHHSIGLFVEAMLRELDNTADADAPMRAAVATWALNLLASQSTTGALGLIANSLMPVIYCQYSPADLGKASAAIRAQVRDPSVLQHNPYFTHTMYVEQVAVDRRAVKDLSVALREAIQANDIRRSFVIRRIYNDQAVSLKTAFRAWRTLVRRAQTVTTSVENRARRHEEALRRLRARSTFYHWRVILEVSRNSFLTERLHEAALQIENAKNQFQLQCYRSDRLVQSGKAREEELVRVRQVNEDLMRQVEDLKEELVQREKEYNEQLARNVAAALALVQSYGRVATALSGARMKPLPYQVEGTGGDEAKKDGADGASAEAPENVEAASPIPVPHSPPQGFSSEVKRGNDSGSQNGAEAPAAAAAAAAGETPAEMAVMEEEEESSETLALDVLRRWCNSVLRAVKGAHFRPIRSFGADFMNGDAYLIILNHVFPDSTSLVPNQESDTDYRLRRIRDMSEKTRLVHVLSPEDFAEKREDRIVQSLGELFNRHLDRQWRANAEAAVSSFTEELNKGADAPPASVTDDASFQAFIAESAAKLEEVKKGLLEQCVHEESLAQGKEHVKLVEAMLVNEERKGLPLLYVGDASTQPFWMLKTSNLHDLRDPAKVGNDSKLWQRLVEKPLPDMLRKHAGLTSRLFCFYAGSNMRTMSEYAFWRFVEMQNFGSIGIQKETIAHIYDHVASPQLANAIRTASYGRSDMDRETLMNVARQELDIRYISPTQFVEILLRLGVEAHGRSLGLVGGVEKFLLDIALPCHAKIGPVQLEFYGADSQYIVHFFSDDLARVFLFYLKRQEASHIARERVMAVQDGGRFAGLMATSTYTRMMTDCSFLGDPEASRRVSSAESTHSGSGNRNKPRGFMSAGQVSDCLIALAKPYPTLKSGDISFTVFLESFTVISYYWCPNPLIPPSRKLAAFLADLISQLNIRHANSTLILGAPPKVELEGGPKVDLAMKANDFMF